MNIHHILNASSSSSSVSSNDDESQGKPRVASLRSRHDTESSAHRLSISGTTDSDVAHLGSPQSNARESLTLQTQFKVDDRPSPTLDRSESSSRTSWSRPPSAVQLPASLSSYNLSNIGSDPGQQTVVSIDAVAKDSASGAERETSWEMSPYDASQVARSADTEMDDVVSSSSNTVTKPKRRKAPNSTWTLEEDRKLVSCLLSTRRCCSTNSCIG
ncbi:hypothetical protein V1511DRAFT_497299 [Dipodascopsis uninucleata]